MFKKFIQKIAFFSAILLLIGVSFGGPSLSFQSYIKQIVPVAYADDDEDEDEDDDEEDEDEDYEERYEQKVVKVKPVYKTVYVEKVVITLDPIFTKDTDRDSIVDGLDPHPTISEKEFFTDDDNDGIANAFDTHKDEDDFAYYEQENDENGNGILDSYEIVAIN
ncbi:MAG: hypothetical protein PHH40_04300 [Candidatus Moranbacteria bacterium]|nr:hypothetical protein [Candidatus Moranbacteria bacterium]MDD3964541.1 hypothetical protein [Candidatus Moranbacteria bacterium]